MPSTMPLPQNSQKIKILPTTRGTTDVLSHRLMGACCLILLLFPSADNPWVGPQFVDPGERSTSLSLICDAILETPSAMTKYEWEMNLKGEGGVLPSLIHNWMWPAVNVSAREGFSSRCKVTTSAAALLTAGTRNHIQNLSTHPEWRPCLSKTTKGFG